MVELGKLILDSYRSFSIKILIAIPPYNAGSTAPYIDSVSATAATRSITFHYLPIVSLSLSTSSRHHETVAFQLLRLNNPHLHQALVSISKNYTVHTLVMDFFCTPALSVAAELKVPAYFFMTSSASCLASLLYLSTIYRSTNESLKDIDGHLDIPGLPPVPAADFPETALDRNDNAYEGLLNVSIGFPKSAGIVVNTFDLL